MDSNAAAVFIAFHSLAHAGSQATKWLMAPWVMWPELNSNVAAWCQDCQQCEGPKPPGSTRQRCSPSPSQPDDSPTFMWTLWVTCGSRYLFTIVDRSSRWLEALPMQDMAAVTCADTLIARWISRYGVPTQLTSDQGAHFILAVWAVLCLQLGIQLQLTTAFHTHLPRRMGW